MIHLTTINMWITSPASGAMRPEFARYRAAAALRNHPRSGGRMKERKPMGMKRLSLQQHNVRGSPGRQIILRYSVARNQFQFCKLGAATIEPITQHRTADVRQMQPNLMRPTRFRPRPHQRITGEPFDDLIRRHRLASACVSSPNRFLLTVRGMIANRLVHHVAVPVGHAHHDR
jgi:hypothetical protein